MIAAAVTRFLPRIVESPTSRTKPLTLEMQDLKTDMKDLKVGWNAKSE